MVFGRKQNINTFLRSFETYYHPQHHYLQEIHNIFCEQLKSSGQERLARRDAERNLTLSKIFLITDDDWVSVILVILENSIG